MTEEELRRLQELDKLADIEAAEAPAQQKVAIAEEGELPTQPTPVEQVQTAQINNEAKSPYQKTKQELVQDSPDMLQKLRDSIQQYQDGANKKVETSSDDNVMNWLTGIGQVGNQLNKLTGTKDNKVEYWGKGVKARQDAAEKQKTDKIKDLQSMYQKYIGLQKKDKVKDTNITPYQQAQLDLSTRKQDLAEKVAEQKTIKPKEISKLEMERHKSDMKNQAALEKENRKIREDSQKSVKDIDKQIAMVKKAQQMLKDTTKGRFADTGPIDQYISPLSSQGQKLRQTFNEISLDKMTKMFAGMSKAIDSDAERKFFEQSQPSMGNYPDVNASVLKQTLENLESLKVKNTGLLNSIDKKR